MFARLAANSVESTEHFFEGTPCWEWRGYRTRRGLYGRVSVRVPGRKSPVGLAVHRVCGELHLGRPLDPDEETIEHRCTITWCWNPLHLALCTRAENSASMRARYFSRERADRMTPLVDVKLYEVDPFAGIAMPKLRVHAEEVAECPF